MTLLVFLGIVFAWALFTEPHPTRKRRGLSCGGATFAMHVPLVRPSPSGILWAAEPRDRWRAACAPSRGTRRVRAPLRIVATRHPRLIEIDARSWMARLSARDGRRVALGRRPGARHRSHRRTRLRPRLADRRLDDRLGQPPHVARLARPCATSARRAPPRWLRRRHRRLAVRDRAYEPADNLGGEERPRDAAHATRPKRASACILDFVPNHTAVRSPVGPPSSRTGTSTPTAEQRGRRSGRAFFEVRSDGRHWIAHGRDPNFPPWPDTAQLDYRHPGGPPGDDPGAARGRDALRRGRLLDGDARPRRRLPHDLGRPVRARRRPPRTPRGSASSGGTRRPPSATSTRISCSSARRTGASNGGSSSLASTTPGTTPLLERFLARDAGRWPATCGPTTPTSAGRSACSRTRDGPRIAARMAPDEERVAALVEATVPGMLLVRDGQIQGARAVSRSSSGANPTSPPTPHLHDFYCRLLRATDDEAFRTRPGRPARTDLGLAGERHATRGSSRGCGSASTGSSGWRSRT